MLSSRGWASEPPAGSGAVRDRWESLAALVRLAEDFAAARQGATLADFVAELDERAAAQHAPTVEGVTLASLHAAKGLEWDAVFLVGLTEGTMPITYAKTDEQVEEERRLLYVGVTRARLHLSLSWALSRSPGGRGGRRPSRFLDGLRPGSAAARCPGRRIGRQRRRGARLRRTQAARPGAVPGVRADAVRRGRDQADALRGLPLRSRRGRCTSGCASGGRSRPRRWASPRTASSPTRRCWRSPRSGRTTRRSWRRSPGSAPASWTGSARTSSRCAPAREPRGSGRPPRRCFFRRSRKIVCASRGSPHSLPEHGQERLFQEPGRS